MSAKYLLELTQQSHDDVPDSVVWPFAEWGTLELDADRLRRDPGSVKVLFLAGGTDVAPARYGERQGKWTESPDPARDHLEIEMVTLARTAGIPIVGICRGAQLLNVIAGGGMVQHIEGHSLGRTGTHTIRALDEQAHPFDLECSSSHHQMMLPPPDAEVFAWAEPRLAGSHYYDGADQLIAPAREYEGIYYPSLNAIGMQWHPEWMEPDHPCVKYSVKIAAAKLGSDMR